MAKFNEPENNAINLIGVGTSIRGDLESTGDLRIDGTLVGNLKTKGKVVVGATGEIKGEIFCKNSDVEGKVEGKIHVQELLSLKGTSIILGDILARRLAIEPGAKFTGNCNMTNSGNQQSEAKSAEEEVKKP